MYFMPANGQKLLYSDTHMIALYLIQFMQTGGSKQCRHQQISKYLLILLVSEN